MQQLWDHILTVVVTGPAVVASLLTIWDWIEKRKKEKH
jgi:hypothetical protein